MLEVCKHLNAVAFWAHVGVFGQDTLHFIRILNHVVHPVFRFGAGRGFGEVNFFPVDLGFHIGWTVVFTLVIRALDVSRGRWK